MKVFIITVAALALVGCGDASDFDVDGADSIQAAAKGGNGGGGGGKGKPPKDDPPEDPPACDAECAASCDVAFAVCGANCADTCGGDMCSDPFTAETVNQCKCDCDDSCLLERIECLNP